ncbi:MAG: sigma-70 family RNA polymerase sigma factor [Terracidiphilus sp.]
MDTASSKPAELVLPVQAEERFTANLNQAFPISVSLIEELWRAAETETCGLNLAEFSMVLSRVGEKVNHGVPAGVVPDAAARAGFYRSLHIAELALAHGCALGREVAWEGFLSRYRSSLFRAAVSITGSATLGQELADSLYAELYGLRQTDGERRSPLASYSGRGSFLGWLRATLVQRWRDHHRRTHRETTLDDVETPALPPSSPVSADLDKLAVAVARTFRNLDAEDRFLLSAYYLDRQTLLQIARTLHVHEATISRRLKRLAGNLRKLLIGNLISIGLSNAAAEEALGTDPRDIEINLRRLLQTSQTSTFSNRREQTATPSPT